MESILSQLNESQKEAVKYNDGPSLVVAGAGSGKTRVLTYKIAALLKLGYEPFNILALTFTNKAAREMRDRIAKIVGEKTASYLWMGTFHSIFAKILRRECQYIEFNKDFTIYDTNDSKNLIKTIIKEMDLDDKVYLPKKVCSRISALKNNLITPSMHIKNREELDYDNYLRIPRLKEIYSTYMRRCKVANAMDFDDLLLYTNILFRDNEDVLKRYQELFKFILVDEYQDTNFSQHLIIKRLAEAHQHISVVGDDAQSIYSFRGANIENILQFQKNYPTAKIFKLEQNYRSTPNIVNVANSLIEKNRGQIKKNVYSKNDEGSKVKVLSSYSDRDESEMVGNIVQAMSKKFEYKDFAILYRTNAQSRLFEEAFRSRAIPYQIKGGHSFYQRKEIKDVLNYFRLIINMNDEEALKRAFKFPSKGIGDTTIQKIADCANIQGVSYWTIISDPLQYNLGINAGISTKLANFRSLIENLSQKVETCDAYEMAQLVLSDCNILSELRKDMSPEGISRLENVDELLNGINEFCEQRREQDGTEISTISEFLQVVSLATDQDEENGDDNNKVTLMTVHASKGLEFKNVIVVGLEEELFPSDMNMQSQNNLEEERRLFYVAITRAECNCIITYAKSRFRNGNTTYTIPSRFLKDIDASLLDLPSELQLSITNTQPKENLSFQVSTGTLGNGNYASKWSDKTISTSDANHYSQSNNYSPSRRLKRIENVAPINKEVSNTATSSTYHVGMTVIHSKFGQGIIKNIEGSGAGEKLIIDFENIGEKKILSLYARLNLIQ